MKKGRDRMKLTFATGDSDSGGHAVIFKSVAQNIAMQDGLYADFSPKPLARESGNGLHINISVKARKKKTCRILH